MYNSLPDCKLKLIMPHHDTLLLCIASGEKTAISRLTCASVFSERVGVCPEMHSLSCKHGWPFRFYFLPFCGQESDHVLSPDKGVWMSWWCDKKKKKKVRRFLSPSDSAAYGFSIPSFFYCLYWIGHLFFCLLNLNYLNERRFSPVFPAGRIQFTLFATEIVIWWLQEE